MKKIYVTPETEITEFSVEDVLSTSLTVDALGDGGYIDGKDVI